MDNGVQIEMWDQDVYKKDDFMGEVRLGTISDLRKHYGKELRSGVTIRRPLLPTYEEPQPLHHVISECKRGAPLQHVVSKCTSGATSRHVISENVTSKDEDEVQAFQIPSNNHTAPPGTLADVLEEPTLSSPQLYANLVGTNGPYSSSLASETVARSIGIGEVTRSIDDVC